MSANQTQMEEYCRERGFVTWFETSAKENINIDEAARCLVTKVLLVIIIVILWLHMLNFDCYFDFSALYWSDWLDQDNFQSDVIFLRKFCSAISVKKYWIWSICFIWRKDTLGGHLVQGCKSHFMCIHYYQALRSLYRMSVRAHGEKYTVA